MEGVLPPPMAPLKTSSFFTPLLCSMLGIIVLSLAVLFYHHILLRYCFRRYRSSSAAVSAAQPPMYTPTGVDKSLLETIPIFSVAEVKLDDFARECIVCISDLQDEDKVRLLPNCNHAFHLQCIDEWFVEHDNCPLCRSPILAQKRDDCKFKAVDLGDSSVENENQLDRESSVSGTAIGDETTSSSFEVELEIQLESISTVPETPRVVVSELKRSVSMFQPPVSLDLERGRLERENGLMNGNSSGTNHLTRSESCTAMPMGRFDRILRSLSRLRSGKWNDIGTSRTALTT